MKRAGNITLLDTYISGQKRTAVSETVEMCLNGSLHSENLSDAFPIQNGLKQRDALSPLL
jgi:hypothetical protein